MSVQYWLLSGVSLSSRVHASVSPLCGGITFVLSSSNFMCLVQQNWKIRQHSIKKNCFVHISRAFYIFFMLFVSFFLKRNVFVSWTFSIPDLGQNSYSHNYSNIPGHTVPNSNHSKILWGPHHERAAHSHPSWPVGRFHCARLAPLTNTMTSATQTHPCLTVIFVHSDTSKQKERRR